MCEQLSTYAFADLALTMASEALFTGAGKSAKNPEVIACTVSREGQRTRKMKCVKSVAIKMLTALSIDPPLTHTENIPLRDTSDGGGRQNMAKWRMKRGVTTLRPPPGGAHAAQMVTSYDTDTQTLHNSTSI